MIDDDLPTLQPIDDPPINVKSAATNEPSPVKTWPTPAPPKPASPPASAFVDIEPATLKTSPMSGCAVPIAIVFSAILIAVSILFSGGGSAAPHDQQHQQQTIDDHGDVAPAPIDSTVVGDLRECLLVVIADGDLVNKEPAYAATMQADEFWDAAAKRVKDVEFLGPGDDIAKKFLSATKLSPPLVALIKGDKHPAWVIPLPKGGPKPIEDKLNGR